MKKIKLVDVELGTILINSMSLELHNDRNKKIRAKIKQLQKIQAQK